MSTAASPGLGRGWVWKGTAKSASCVSQRLSELILLLALFIALSDASGCTSRTHSRTNSEAFHGEAERKRATKKQMWFSLTVGFLLQLFFVAVHVDTMPVAGPLEAANTALSEPTDKPRSVSPINAKEKLTKNLKKGLDFLRARRP